MDAARKESVFHLLSGNLSTEASVADIRGVLSIVLDPFSAHLVGIAYDSERYNALVKITSDKASLFLETAKTLKFRASWERAFMTILKNKQRAGGRAVVQQPGDSGNSTFPMVLGDVTQLFPAFFEEVRQLKEENKKVNERIQAMEEAHAEEIRKLNERMQAMEKAHAEEN